jgi:hypothetical protein
MACVGEAMKYKDHTYTWNPASKCRKCERRKVCYSYIKDTVQAERCVDYKRERVKHGSSESQKAFYLGKSLAEGLAEGLLGCAE